jgi:hypothetical protein
MATPHIPLCNNPKGLSLLDTCKKIDKTVMKVLDSRSYGNSEGFGELRRTEVLMNLIHIKYDTQNHIVEMIRKSFEDHPQGDSIQIPLSIPMGGNTEQK